MHCSTCQPAHEAGADNEIKTQICASRSRAMNNENDQRRARQRIYAVFMLYAPHAVRCGNVAAAHSRSENSRTPQTATTRYKYTRTTDE